jgi:hypothetical protein
MNHTFEVGAVRERPSIYCQSSTSTVSRAIGWLRMKFSSSKTDSIALFDSFLHPISSMLLDILPNGISHQNNQIRGWAKRKAFKLIDCGSLIFPTRSCLALPSFLHVFMPRNELRIVYFKVQGRRSWRDAQTIFVSFLLS